MSPKKRKAAAPGAAGKAKKASHGDDEEDLPSPASTVPVIRSEAAAKAAATATAAASSAITTTATATTTSNTTTTTEHTGTPASKSAAAADRALLHEEIKYQPMSLLDIHTKIRELCRRVPQVPADNFMLSQEEQEAERAKLLLKEDNNNNNNSNNNNTKNKNKNDTTTTTTTSTLPKPSDICLYNKVALKQWASQLQTVIEEFHLLIAMVNAATYVWGTDRSGAADQHLNLLSNELVRSQEQIMARVTPRLNDVLAPVVTLLTDKTVTTKTKLENGDEQEVRQNHFITTYEDPDYVNLCFTILARNSVQLRQVVLCNLDKLLQAIQDYLAAQHKDSQHDSRGFVY